MTRRHRFAAATVAAAVVAASAAVVTTTAGCAPGPMARPNTGPMNKPVAVTSTDTTGDLEVVRRQLMGTWELVALESAPTAGAARVPVRAAGTLVYDEFGNLTIDAHTTDAAAPVAAREVSRMAFKGRAVIDVVRRELKLMDVTGNVDPNEVLAPERRRRFELEMDTLRLSSFDDKGQVTAIATWHRRA